MLRHFFIEGRYYGNSDAPRQLWMGGLTRPPSLVYICPRCGETWARIAIGNSDFQSALHPCRKHSWHAGLIPGSLLVPYDRDAVNSFPPEALAWEFARHLDYAESKQA